MADTAEEKKSWAESGFDASIPIWDGKGDSLREYKRTVRWWLSSIDLEKTKYFNLAARFAMRQKGSAKLCALEFDPKDLEYKPAATVPDPETGDEVEVSPVDYTYGGLEDHRCLGKHGWKDRHRQAWRTTRAILLDLEETSYGERDGLCTSLQNLGG